MSELYHKDVFWKSWFKKECKEMIYTSRGIVFSKHCVDQQSIDWKRRYDLKDINFRMILSGSIFEVEVENKKVIKFVTRVSLNEKHDICLVFIKSDRQLFCKTMWLNDKVDKHSTLKTAKYCTE